MESIGVTVFNNINFYERYKSLSDQTRKNDDRLETPEKSIVLNIFEDLGYTAKFISKGQFYRIEDTLNDWNFNLHLSLKYGLTEVILGCKNPKANLLFGGPASLICEAIEYQKGIQSDEMVKKPSFANYDILQETFKEVLSIYEDLKKETLKI